MKPRQGTRAVGAAGEAKQRHRAEFAVDDARRLKLAPALGVHSRGEFGHGGSRLARFAAGAIDFELGDRPFARGAPAQDVLAAAFGMPEDLVRSLFYLTNRTG